MLKNGWFSSFGDLSSRKRLDGVKKKEEKRGKKRRKKGKSTPGKVQTCGCNEKTVLEHRNIRKAKVL